MGKTGAGLPHEANSSSAMGGEVCCMGRGSVISRAMLSQPHPDLVGADGCGDCGHFASNTLGIDMILARVMTGATGSIGSQSLSTLTSLLRSFMRGSRPLKYLTTGSAQRFRISMNEGQHTLVELLLFVVHDYA